MKSQIDDRRYKIKLRIYRAKKKLSQSGYLFWFSIKKNLSIMNLVSNFFHFRKDKQYQHIRD